MKQIVLGLIAFSSTLFSNELPEYTLNTIDPSLMETYKKGKLQAILHIEQGDKIPLSFEVCGSLLSLSDVSQPIYLEALAPFYVKCENNTFTFSFDKQNWKPFEEQFGGHLNASLSVSDEIGPQGTITLKLDPK